jgi:hypothetical protein
MQLLSSNSATFASIEYTTDVATAAKHKAMQIAKHTTANVTLFGNIKDFDVYRRAVVKSASKLENDSESVASFETQENYFEHDAECFSIVKHKTQDKWYLYAHYNHATSTFTINGIPATREEVAQYLTKAASEKMLQDNSIVHNVTNDVQHSVICRTVGLENITSITANKTRVEFR